MKSMNSRAGQGANRSNSRSYCEDLQRRHACEGAISCFDTFGSQYQGKAEMPQARTGTDQAVPRQPPNNPARCCRVTVCCPA